MCSSRKNPYPPYGRSLEIPTKFLKGIYENKLEFPGGREGGRGQNKTPSVGVEWIFSGTAQYKGNKLSYAYTSCRPSYITTYPFNLLRLTSLSFRMHSFGMIQIQISDPDHSDHGTSKEPLDCCPDHSGFSDSFDAPWSEWYGSLILIQIIPKECNHNLNSVPYCEFTTLTLTKC